MSGFSDYCAKVVDAAVAAFGMGATAANRDLPRASNPFMPETERYQYEAWNLGYAEHDLLYRIPIERSDAV